MRPRTGVIGAVMRVRNSLAYATHTFFQKSGFMYANPEPQPQPHPYPNQAVRSKLRIKIAYKQAVGAELLPNAAPSQARHAHTPRTHTQARHATHDTPRMTHARWRGSARCYEKRYLPDLPAWPSPSRSLAATLSTSTATLVLPH